MKKLFVFISILLLILISFLLFVFGIYKLANSETFQVAGEIIPRVETNEKIVALTFDDGPTEHADEILSVLKERDVWATFFLIGDNIAQYKMEAENIVQAGHQIGNHSYTHTRMVFKSNQFIRDEIEKTNQQIRNIGYDKEIVFRPPYGKKLIGLPLYLKQHNIKTITWDVEPQKALGDQVNTQQIIEYVKQHTKPGSIILIHPWYGDDNPSRAAIPGIIDELKIEGYRFVTVEELVKLKS